VHDGRDVVFPMTEHRQHESEHAMGCVIRQKGRKTYLIQYIGSDGKRVTESAKTDSKAAATAFLKLKEGKVANGEAVVAERAGTKGWTFDDAVAAMLRVARSKRRTSSDAIERMTKKHLIPTFGGRKLADITADDITDYELSRQAAAKQGTINLELATLRRVFKLAHEQGKISKRPAISIVEQPASRFGFFEPEQFARVHAELPPWLHGAATFAYFTGWRVASEVAQLEWTDVQGDAIVLPAHKTKGRKARVLPLAVFPQVRAAIDAARDQRVADLKAGRPTSPYLFHRDGRRLAKDAHGSQRCGSLHDWARKAWQDACTRAGVPGMLLHDFRRTAARNLIRAGIPQSVAMKVTGHETPHVFERYNITDESDLKQALGQYSAYMTTRQTPPLDDDAAA
jgi:integrase